MTKSAQKKPEVKNKHKHNSKKAHVAISPELAADIQSAQPFVTEVINRIRCKPESSAKLDEMFESIGVPESRRFAWMGPWFRPTVPDGACMEPLPGYVWANEKGRYKNAGLSVKVKWKGPNGRIENHIIYLRQLPNLGWRVSLMELTW